MNPFILIQEIYSSPVDFLLLICSSPIRPPDEYYEGSYYLPVDDMTAKFINFICSVEIPEGKTLVCYDSGDLYTASKAYWAFRAAGFANVKIMPRSSYSPNMLQLVQGTPQMIPKSDRPYLPFNNELAMTKEEFLKRETFYQQPVQVNYLAFNILDAAGNLQSAEAVLGFLQSSGIKFSQSRASIVHGKRACLGGVMLAYVTKRTVSVVIDEIESLGAPVTRDSRTRDVRGDKSDDSGELKYNTAMAGYSVSVDDSSKRQMKKSVNTRDTGTCKNCEVF